MSDPLDQLFPRLSLSYAVSDAVNINANVGRFYQLPPYTVLGFRNGAGSLLNLDNGIRYIQADHVVAGVEYFTKNNGKISVEGFHKWYDRYPLLLDKGISLANLGGDFGVIGNELAAPLSQGRSYGIEFLLQQKLYKGFYGILSYTFVKSEFTNADGGFAPSSWDYGHILNLTGGKRLPKDWEVAFELAPAGRWPFHTLRCAHILAHSRVGCHPARCAGLRPDQYRAPPDLHGTECTGGQALLLQDLDAERLLRCGERAGQ